MIRKNQMFIVTGDIVSIWVEFASQWVTRCFKAHKNKKKSQRIAKNFEKAIWTDSAPPTQTRFRKSQLSVHGFDQKGNYKCITFLNRIVADGRNAWTDSNECAIPVHVFGYKPSNKQNFDRLQVQISNVIV